MSFKAPSNVTQSIVVEESEAIELAQLVSAEDMVVASDFDEGDLGIIESPWDASLDSAGDADEMFGTNSEPFDITEGAFDPEAFMTHLDAATSFFFSKNTFVRTKALLTENTDYDNLLNDVVKASTSQDLTMTFSVETAGLGHLTTLANPANDVELTYDEEYGFYEISGDKADVSGLSIKHAVYL